MTGQLMSRCQPDYLMPPAAGVSVVVRTLSFPAAHPLSPIKESNSKCDVMPPILCTSPFESSGYQLSFFAAPQAHRKTGVDPRS